jgi:hypothetical protein
MRIPKALPFALGLVALPAQAKDPAQGATTFYSYDGYLSPAQEPGEETETPKLLQKSLGGTAPSTPREERKSRGHGQLRFSRDMTRAYVDVQIQGVNPADIVMFHIHCGPPGFLGPIIVDFGEFGELSKTMATGKFTAELTNKNVKFVKSPPTIKSKLPESCPIDVGFPSQTSTLSGLDYLARKGVLYFNLHTKAHTYYGEMRGQIYPSRE